MGGTLTAPWPHSSCLYHPGPWAPASRRARSESLARALRPGRGRLVTSMNPLSLEGSTMVPSSPLRHLRSLVRRVRLGVPTTRPEAEMPLALPRRIDGPAAAAQFARDLLRNRREDITLAIYLDDRHRLVGSAILAVGWVQATRLSARPILHGAQACRATSCVLVRYRRWGGLIATEPEDRSFRALAMGCDRDGLPIVDHLVVTGSGRP